MNLRGRTGETVLHCLYRNLDVKAFRRLLETDFAGFDWTVRDDQGRSFAEVPLEYSAQMTSGYREIQDMNDLWNQRWIGKTSVALEESTPLIDPLRNICLEYLTGKGRPFLSREEQKERDSEMAELEALIMQQPTPSSSEESGEFDLMPSPSFPEESESGESEAESLD